jgi:hypothetical protein
MSNDLVERVARELCRSDGKIPDAVIAPDGLRGFQAWENYKPKASAAIAIALEDAARTIDARAVARHGHDKHGDAAAIRAMIKE